MDERMIVRNGGGEGIRFVDLFSGLGGFRLALEGLGGRCVFSSEIERRAREAYHANFGEWPSGDITAIRAEDMPDHDILCGGFPCQCFSIAGKRMGFADETRGTLFFEIVRILRARQPSAAFLENVRHLATHAGGRTLAVIRRTLEDCGYTVFWRVLDASMYGARTARHRIYIVAFRADLGVGAFAFPEPTHAPAALAEVLLPDSDTDDCVVRNHPVHIDQDAVAKSRGRVSTKPVPVGRIGDRKPAKQGYRIYDPSNGPAVTFLKRGGGIGAESGLYLVNGRVRKLHPREMARAMGYPDSFAIPGSITSGQARGLFGNSVAVPAVRRIFERIVETLAPRIPIRPKAHSSESSQDRAPTEVAIEGASTSATKGRDEA